MLVALVLNLEILFIHRLSLEICTKIFFRANVDGGPDDVIFTGNDPTSSVFLNLFLSRQDVSNISVGAQSILFLVSCELGAHSSYQATWRKIQLLSIEKRDFH